MTIAQFDTLIAGFADNGGNTAAELRTMLTAIKNSCLIPNEIKYIFVPTAGAAAFMSANFTAGLGNSGTIYEGWAVKGTNGTTAVDGKVLIGYGSTYNVLGATGGNADAVAQTTTGAGVAGASDHFPLYPTGASLTGTNMQPYEVVLIIQRVA